MMGEILYNVVATSHSGATKRGVVSTIADIMISASYSIELVKQTTGNRIVLTRMVMAPDESSIEMVYSYGDGSNYLTIIGNLVHVDDKDLPDILPDNVINAVNDIWKAISKD